MAAADLRMTNEDFRPDFVLPSKDGGWHLLVWVQPGAKKSEFAGMQDGKLRIRLAAPAVDNKANKALTAFIADALHLKNAQVRLLAGETGRRKRVFVDTTAEPDWGLLYRP